MQKRKMGAEVAIFRQTAAIPTQEIVGGQKFTFAAKFFQDNNFSAPNFVFL